MFNSSSTNADLFAHFMQGVVRSGQQIVPEINVPYSKPSESLSDLSKLSTGELQSRFEAAFIKDKEYEIQRMKAALAGKKGEVNKILELENKNSQELINLGDALERRGIKPQIPESEGFQTAANQSAEDHVKALKEIQENCKVQ